MVFCPPAMRTAELCRMVQSRSNYMWRESGLTPYWCRGIVYSVVSVLVLGFTSAFALAQDVLSNVELCNGRDRSSPEPKIRGCSELIKTNADNVMILAFAYNNRGNAYTTQGQYDLAMEDYNKAINLNPGFAKPINNRGVVHKKKVELDLAMKDFDAAINLDSN